MNKERLLPFDYKQLQALDVVVSEQNFERAARRLNLTQSAVSQRIKLLEQAVAQPLLVRTSPPTPTPLGQQLLSPTRPLQHAAAPRPHHSDGSEQQVAPSNPRAVVLQRNERQATDEQPDARSTPQERSEVLPR